MARTPIWLIAAAAGGLLIAGCGSGGSRIGATTDETVPRVAGLNCPNGLEDVRSGILDYGVVAYAHDGHPTPRSALATFASSELPTLAAEDFVRAPAQERDHVRFVYDRAGARLADLSVGGYRGRWFVTGFKVCAGPLADSTLDTE